MSRVEFIGSSDRGRIRPRNEDRWSADPEHGLFIVADGMGGRRGGEVAAQMVVDRLPALLREHEPCVMHEGNGAAAESIQSVLVELNREFHDCGRKEPRLVGMGSTVVALLLRESDALIAHLGDSRAYRLRSSRLTRLTHDHSIVQYLIDLGEIPESAAESHPSRGQLSRFVGMEEEALPEVRSIALEARDRLLLCSDGLTSMVADEHIADILCRHDDAQDACAALIDAAKDAGGRDNVTVLLVEPNAQP